jgi:hypothetical protein
MLKCGRLLFVFWGCTCLWAQTGQTAEPITRMYKADGWKIPGISNAHPKNDTPPHSSHDRNGVSYQTTVLVPSNTTTVNVPFVWLDSSNHRFSYEERTIRVKEIRAYEANARPYCYQVSAMVYSEDPTSKVGGWAGIIDLWFYDETGYGKWTIMDTAGPLLPDVPTPPRWAETKNFR